MSLRFWRCWTLAEGYITEDTVLKFWSCFEAAGPYECWTWHGYVSCGTAKLYIRRQRAVSAKQFQWVLTHGEPVIGEQLHLTCGNNLCVNPAHIVSHPKYAADTFGHLANGLRPKNPQRTHCRVGHDLTQPHATLLRSSRIEKDGSRYIYSICRECTRIRGAKKYQMQKEALHEARNHRDAVAIGHR